MTKDKEKRKPREGKKETSERKNNHAKSSTTSPLIEGSQGKKRKRENKDDDSTTSQRSIHMQDQTPTKSPISNKRKEKRRVDNAEPKKLELAQESEPSRASPSPNATASHLNHEEDGVLPKKTKKRKKEIPEDGEEKDRSNVKNASQKTQKREHSIDTAPHNEVEGSSSKHAKLLQKFERSTKLRNVVTQDTQSSATAVDISTAIVARGLEPLPQPEPIDKSNEKPTYPTMPDWITNPVTKSPYDHDGETINFNSINLDKAVVTKLEKHGYKDATPVQSTVIPLLLDEKYRHRGDLCVSASTGSGKTLSYVLPINQSLQREPNPRLRALIVVPTRELVKQARGAFEVCGSNLRIGTAIGNVALKQEQQKLMRWDSIYSPEKYAANQERVMSKSDWADFDLLKYGVEVGRSRELLPQYVHAPCPNIDVLISTPGRLVDHIRQTEEFTLRHLQWLIVDEADRLLNESFQEWVSVLMTALEKDKTANAGDTVLGMIGRPLQSSYPKKVILSATLTNDITKLNSLRLNNPKLITIGSKDIGSTEEATSRETEQFVLPSTLTEHYVAVGDGGEKPIHLMKLLFAINKSQWNSIATSAFAAIRIKSNISDDETSSDEETISDDETSSDEETSSDDETSSSDGDSASSSGTSESDSDSDSDSDSEFKSSSDSSSNSSSDSSSDDSDSSSESESDVSSVDEKKSSVDISTKPDTGAMSILIFTKSTESAARLSHLLVLMNPALKNRIGTIVKSNNSSSSRRTLRDYRAGRIKIIVATDRASRGIDLVDLGVVINYDMPTSLTTYVHRVGRTARAGKSGQAWTLVEHREGLWFQKTIVRSENVVRSKNVMKPTRPEKITKGMISEYTAALEALEKAVKG